MSDGKVRINWDLCTNCGKCVPVCPPKALYLFGEAMTVDQVLAEVEQDSAFYRESGGGITLSGGECLLQADFAAALLAEAHRRGINTAIETAGNVPWALHGEGAAARGYRAARPQADRPGTPQEMGRRGQQAHAAPISSGPTRRFPTPSSSARTPLIPGVNDDEEHIRATLAFIRPYKNVIDYELLPYMRFGESKYGFLGRVYEMEDFNPPSPETLARLRAIIDEAFGRSGKAAEGAAGMTQMKNEHSEGVNRRQFATNTGALLGILAVGEPALGQAPVAEAAKGGTSTGPWDNPALAKFREWDPPWVEQCLKMSGRSVDQRRAATQRRRADQPGGECGLYEPEPRGNPPAYSRRTRSRRQPRRDPDDPEDRVASVDPYVQPGRTHSVGRSEGGRCEANAEGGGDAGLRQDESRGPVESGVGRVLRDRPGLDGSDHRREPPGLHERRILAQAGGTPEHRRRCVGDVTCTRPEHAGTSRRP